MGTVLPCESGVDCYRRRGVWMLTEQAAQNLSHDQAYDLFRAIHDNFQRANATLDRRARRRHCVRRSDNASAPDETAFSNQDAIQEKLVNILRSITDKGFEELCARLLRHIGFENVKVTGESGDHGIDGEGYLLINRFVRTKVMFQCKRYVGAVQVKDLRDFRGAIQGRSERGIFLTTGTFTKGARDEAARENATAIELVDIDRLLELLIEEGLGVRETKALTIDHDFFAHTINPMPMSDPVHSWLASVHRFASSGTPVTFPPPRAEGTSSARITPKPIAPAPLTRELVLAALAEIRRQRAEARYRARARHWPRPEEGAAPDSARAGRRRRARAHGAQDVMPTRTRCRRPA